MHFLNNNPPPPGISSPWAIRQSRDLGVTSQLKRQHRIRSVTIAGPRTDQSQRIQTKLFIPSINRTKSCRHTRSCVRCRRVYQEHTSPAGAIPRAINSPHANPKSQDPPVLEQDQCQEETQGPRKMGSTSRGYHQRGQ